MYKSGLSEVRRAKREIQRKSCSHLFLLVVIALWRATEESTFLGLQLYDVYCRTGGFKSKEVPVCHKVIRTVSQFTLRNNLENSTD